MALDLTYKPIHWLMADGTPVGYSHTDLERLAELGWHWLEGARVHPDHWQREHEWSANSRDQGREITPRAAPLADAP